MSLWQRFTSVPLRYKLIGSLIVTSLVVIGITAYTLAQYNRAIPTTTTELLRQLAQERRQQVSAAFEDVTSILAQVSNSQSNLFSFTQLNATPGSLAASSKLREVFSLVLNAKPQIKQIRYTSLTGRVLASLPILGSDDDTGQEYFRVLHDHLPASGGIPYISQIASQPAPTVEVATVLFSNNQPLGFLVASVDITGSADPNALSVYWALRGIDLPPFQFAFYLLGADGTITIPGRQPITLTAATTASARQLSASEPNNAIQYDSPLSGASATGFAVHVDGTQLTLITETALPAGGLSSESGRFLLPLFGLLIVGLLLIALVGTLLEITIARPAEALLIAANRAVQGRDLGELQPIAQRDELGLLYNAVGALAALSRRDARSMEEILAERTRDVETTRDFGLALSSVHDLESVLRQAVDLLHQRFRGIDAVQVFLTETRRDFATLRAGSGDAVDARLTHGYGMSIDAGNAVGRAIRGRESVAVLESSGAAHDLLPGMRSELLLPLIAQGEVIGALDLQSTHAETFSEAEMRLFQSVASLLAGAVYSARLLDDARDNLREIELLNRQLIGTAWQDYAATRQGRLPGASTRSAETQSWSETQRRAAETGEIVERIGEDIVTFAVPVSLRGQVLGAVEWDIPRGAYTENARQLARELAGRLAISADNARLFEQAQRVAQRERLVNEIAGKLAQQTDVSEILKVAVREVGQALRVPQTSIRLASAQQSDKEPEAGEAKLRMEPR